MHSSQPNANSHQPISPQLLSQTRSVLETPFDADTKQRALVQHLIATKHRKPSPTGMYELWADTHMPA